MTEENEVVATPPKLPQYTKADFMTPEPYTYLIDNFGGSESALAFATLEMADNAKAVGFVGFRDTLKICLKEYKAAARRCDISNSTDFSNQPIELNCGQWECWDNGIFRTGRLGVKECACPHPIMPIERLRNLDTGEVQVKLAFNRSGKAGHWQTLTTDVATISTARTIVPALANRDCSVTGSTAPILVDYLNDLLNLNRDLIPESKSIGRLGHIPGYGFSPYVPDLVFDGEASFKNLYDTIKQEGSIGAWYDAIMECRKMSVTAKILIAASFAAPILSIVGALPFFVHLWGVDSGTGKTVGLMAAASVWGNPALGSYIQTFNATQVGHERTAAFLNHLPMCIDELQLTKDSHGRSNFDVYQLAQGVGRARGKRSGGIEQTPTWSTCFLTTGESPIFGNSAGAGAVNRVIDIECTAGDAVIKDGQRISGVLKQNYGFAGPIFVEKLYSSEKVLQQVRDVYNENFHELRQGDSTEKQAMAAAAILTADFLATIWIYGDDGETLLTADEIGKFLASRDAVSAGKRAHEWLLDWISANEGHFRRDGESLPNCEIYGAIEKENAYIIKSVFEREITNAGFSSRAVLSYLKTNNLIDTRADKGFTKTKRIGESTPQCVCLHLNSAVESPVWDGLPL